MTREKILEAISIYEARFAEMNLPQIAFPRGVIAGDRRQVLAHCYGMLLQMREFIAQGRLEKAFRWLGFIQGCLWCLGVYPLEELKNHNRPDDQK